MTEPCPSCRGDRNVTHPDALAGYVHGPRCTLARDEQETLDADRARFRRYGTPSRHRPITPAERVLLAASGVRVPVECFTCVTWDGVTRTRTWRRAPVVSVTSVKS